MKKRFLASILVVSVILFISCKKDDLTPPLITTSQWQYSNVTYNGDSTYFSGGTMVSHDKLDLNGIEISFLGRPIESGTYTVSSADSGPISSTDCIVEGDYLVTSTLTSRSFASTGSERDKVDVTISPTTGKITATFVNVTVADGPAVKYVSGTIIEK